MELSDKIHKLRKEHNLTQEQFAQKLFVSRTAVSKWETGRGTPSMESLKQIATLFDITLDELLSTEEIVVIAQSENKENIKRLVTYIDGALNIAVLLSLLLPLYKAQENDIFYCVPLYQFTGWQEVLFYIVPIVIAVCGILQIVFTRLERERLASVINMVSTVLYIVAILILILCGQPYSAVLFFFLFMMKGVLLLKKHK